jgi:cyclopropane-fatty-acyl-phospholipid synthase
MRRLIARGLANELASGVQDRGERFARWVEELRSAPLAVHTADANRQHYEVPAEYFRLVLGPRLKYSSCFYPDGVTDLGTAEEAMLELSCERAELADGMEILELGCGWGSLSLWMAERYPNARILSISNSASQREFILGRAAERGLRNVEVLTRDVNVFSTERRFDRVVSVEMFEHLRNYRELFRRIAGWLNPAGKLWCHVFCHRDWSYPFETEGDDNWMGRYFFTGGTMPSDGLFAWFQDDLRLERQWRVNGTHYARTLLAWLALQDARKDEVMRVMRSTYGQADAAVWFQRWRMFYLACAELFGFHGGNEWYVGHYLMSLREAPVRPRVSELSNGYHPASEPIHA